MNNKYYICLKDNNQPIDVDFNRDLADLEQKIIANEYDFCTFFYFLKVSENIEKISSIKGFTFYLTYENLDRLPSYGQNVVAIVLGDEWCRTPKYSHLVKAVFKCYGTSLTLGCNPLLKPSYLNIMTLFNFTRIWTTGLSGRLNYGLEKLKSWRSGKVKTASIYDIPLGYFNQLDLPIKAIEDRPYDVFFAGSIEQRLYSIWSWKYWLRSPKTIARKEMMSAINSIIKENCQIKFDLTINSHFGASRSADARSYSEKVMDTKICLVPRGASLETYRFYEAIRYGCIVITEALPSRWFYDDSPAIQINDWNELKQILPELLDRQDLMKQKHQESLDWWNTKCSETAVAKYIARQLNHIDEV